MLSYAAGNLVAACGNAGETLLWGLVGGMPSDWVAFAWPDGFFVPA
jgi:hypothetical protein